LILCLGWTPVLAEDDSTEDAHIQVLLGATRYFDLNFQHRSTTDPSVEATSEITVMPALGISGGMPLLKGPVTLGLEGGALFSWRNDSVTAVGQGGGNVRVYIDNKLYLLDLFFGPYVIADLGQRTRIYAGAGPLLMVGQYDTSSDEHVSESETIREDESSMASGVGLQARAGIEFKFEDGSLMGLCVRGFNSRLDFEDVAEDTDVKGLQFLITFTPTP
jgi:opacity protein-like surface antigen